MDRLARISLGGRLFDIFGERAGKIAIVRGDDGVESSQVASTVDIMRGSGIEHVGVITAKTETGQLLESLQPSELVIFRRSHSS